MRLPSALAVPLLLTACARRPAQPAVAEDAPAPAETLVLVDQGREIFDAWPVWGGSDGELFANRYPQGWVRYDLDALTTQEADYLGQDLVVGVPGPSGLVGAVVSERTTLDSLARAEPVGVHEQTDAFGRAWKLTPAMAGTWALQVRAGAETRTLAHFAGMTGAISVSPSGDRVAVLNLLSGIFVVDVSGVPKLAAEDTP